MTKGPENLWITILAGGIGSRFWPISTPERPKQLLPLASERPLIVDTVERARSLTPESRIRILTGSQLETPFRSVLPDLPPDALMIEPQARGTAPALAWAAWSIANVDPDAVLVSLHADHLIRPIEAFHESVLTGVAIAERERRLVTIGANPDRAETGYGYIQPGAPIPGIGDYEGHAIDAFHEKPDSVTATRYVEDGYLWNTGIFIWKAADLLNEVEKHAPEIARHLPSLDQGPESFFGSVPSETIDVAIMERTDRAAVVPARFEWDDVGAWEALARSREADLHGNVTLGSGTPVESRGNIVVAEGGEIVLFGVDNLVVVQTEKTTLVTTRERSPELKRLLGHLEGFSE